MQNTKSSGQSLIEALVASAIGAIMMVAAVGLIVSALRFNSQTDRAQTGAALAKELLENVRLDAEGDWHLLANLATSSVNHYYVSATSSPFRIFSGNESVLVSTTTYVRYFYVDDVYRNGSDAIVAAGGSYDPSTKKVTVAYSWPLATTSTISEYMTRNRDNIFIQTDWSGGSGQNGPTTTVNNRFSSSSNVNFASTTGSFSISGIP